MIDQSIFQNWFRGGAQQQDAASNSGSNNLSVPKFGGSLGMQEEVHSFRELHHKPMNVA